MAHIHPVYDTNEPFVIDADSGLITYPSGGALVLIQMDHNSERYTFKMPRYIDGHDMANCDLVRIHYINISSENTRNKQTGIYTVTDLKVSADDENTVTWTWLVSQNATQYVGSLNFAVRFACTSGSKIDYLWNTRVYSSISVLASIDNSDIIIEQYDDVLQIWYMELFASSTSGVNMVVDARDAALASISAAADAAAAEVTSDIINMATDDIVESVKQEVLIEAREEIITEVLERIPIYNGEVV